VGNDSILVEEPTGDKEMQRRHRARQVLDALCNVDPNLLGQDKVLLDKLQKDDARVLETLSMFPQQVLGQMEEFYARLCVA
jgi:hypothetical protein